MSRQNHCDFTPQLVSADFERDEVLELSLESSHELGPGSDAVRVEPLCWRQSFPSLRRLGFRHLHLFRWPKPATLKNLLWQNLCVILLYERFLNLYLVLLPQELDWIHAYFPVFFGHDLRFLKKGEAAYLQSHRYASCFQRCWQSLFDYRLIPTIISKSNDGLRYNFTPALIYKYRFNLVRFKCHFITTINFECLLQLRYIWRAIILTRYIWI